MTTIRSGWRAWLMPFAVAAMVVGWLTLSFAAGAQTPAPAAPVPKPAAKAAKPAAKKPGPNDFKLVLEPKAMDLLRAVSERLAAAKSMSFTAVVGYEYPSKLGPPIVYTSRYDVTMQRPDRLRVLMPGDGPASEFYYDGKTMIAFAPAENLAAFADAPPTIEAALDQAFKTAGIYFPFEDLLVPDPFAALTKGAILAFTIGPSANIGGVKTDMLAWASNDVFFQIWIGADDRLPRRVRAIFRADPLGLRHQVDYSDWKLDPVIAPDTFASAKALNAGRMAFAAPSPPPKGVKPITQGTKSVPATPAKSTTR